MELVIQWYRVQIWLSYCLALTYQVSWDRIFFKLVSKAVNPDVKEKKKKEKF